MKDLRRVIFHYHLFKNAGTSVDAILRSNFSNQWVAREFGPMQHHENIAAVGDWIRLEPRAIAFSSHTAMLPPPKCEGIEVFPLLFIRHPLDRVASVYAFERKQGLAGHEGYGPILARNSSLAGFVDVLLATPEHRQIRNFQTARLSQNFPNSNGHEHEHAKQALYTLPFVGIVDLFEQSVDAMIDWLAPSFPGFRPFSVHCNRAEERGAELQQRILDLEREIGPELFQKLIEANSLDLELYETARMRITNVRPAP